MPLRENDKRRLTPKGYLLENYLFTEPAMARRRYEPMALIIL